MKILFIVSRIPYPLEKGDKLRAFNHLKLLAEKHEVTLIAIHEGKIHPDTEEVIDRYCKKFIVFKIPRFIRILKLIRTAFGTMPFSTAYFYNTIIAREIEEIIDNIHPAHIYCQLTRVAEYVRYTDDIPKTLDYQDAFAKGFEKRMMREPFYKRWLLKTEWERLKKYETEIFDRFDNKIIISEQDRNNIDHPDKNEIIIVPNGVDLDHYRPQQMEKKYDLLFTGNMAYPPNIESVVFLVNKVLPLVKETKPDVKLLIAGANPTGRVKSLAGKNVEVSGWLDDLRTCYAASRIFVAPMQISIGLQNKLLEAMAMKIPCITSELANNALGGTNNENIIVCNKPEEYAHAIIRLLENAEEADKLACAGNDFIRANFNWKKKSEPLLNLF